MFVYCLQRRHLVDALRQLGSAFEVDSLFKRTFVNAIPAWELHKFVASKMFHVYDICVALKSFCSREVVPTAKVRDVFDNLSRSICCL